MAQHNYRGFKLVDGAAFTGSWGKVFIYNDEKLVGSVDGDCPRAFVDRLLASRERPSAQARAESASA